MTKFMLLYIAPISAEEQMAHASPEDMQKGMELWMAWFKKMESAIVDGGAPLGHKTSVTKDGSAGSQVHIGGYTIIQAEDISAAKALVAGHPHFMMPGGSIEIHEVLPMPGT